MGGLLRGGFDGDRRVYQRRAEPPAGQDLGGPLFGGRLRPVIEAEGVTEHCAIGHPTASVTVEALGVQPARVPTEPGHDTWQPGDDGHGKLDELPFHTSHDRTPGGTGTRENTDPSRVAPPTTSCRRPSHLLPLPRARLTATSYSEQPWSSRYHMPTRRSGAEPSPERNASGGHGPAVAPAGSRKKCANPPRRARATSTMRARSASSMVSYSPSDPFGMIPATPRPASRQQWSANRSHDSEPSSAKGVAAATYTPGTEPASLLVNSFHLLAGLRGLPGGLLLGGHPRFDARGVDRQRVAQHHRPRRGDHQVVFDAHAEAS